MGRLMGAPDGARRAGKRGGAAATGAERTARGSGGDGRGERERAY